MMEKEDVPGAIKVMLCGASGNMGREMAASICSNSKFALVSAVDMILPTANCPCHTSIKEVSERADVIVDFSHHTAISQLLPFAMSNKMPLVIATTGHTQEEIRQIEDASSNIPIFFCGNMSMGIAVLFKIAKEVATAFPHVDIEIVETHHSRKKDVPSGTALMLARGIQSVRTSKIVVGRQHNGVRENDEIGISSLRLGCDIGKHEVFFDTGCERITLSHQAYSRTLYADGTLNAIEFIIKKDHGLYDMQDILNQKDEK